MVPSTNDDLERRVVALVLPSLLCELAEPRTSSLAKRRQLPLAVVLADPSTLSAESSSGSEGAELKITAVAVLSAVNDVAQRLGIRAGQTVAEARAFSSTLVVRHVPPRAVEEGLARVAEIALAFGTIVAFSAPDTVWVDISGAAHLFGGEAGLLAELVSRVREAGHRVRAALASGPLLAQAFARHGEIGKEGHFIANPAKLEKQFARLPIRALSLPSELESWFVRLGVLTINELWALPKSALAGRLGEHAPSVLELMAGRDATPLIAYVPSTNLVEQSSWDEPIDGNEPLLFVVRGLSARLAARLAGRGQAACVLVLEILAHPGTARFRGAELSTRLEFKLPKPLWKAEELNRIVTSRLERLRLEAPSVGVRLEITKLSEATPRQLELGFWGVGAGTALDELPIVIAELTADLGEDRVGLLQSKDSHRPELASRLVAAMPAADAGHRRARPGSRLRRSERGIPDRAVKVIAEPGSSRLVHRLTRLLPEPVPFEAALRVDAAVALGRRLYTIDSLCFQQRLESVEWWAGAIHRDYVLVRLRGTGGLVEGLVYVDRESGKRYWQGVVD